MLASRFESACERAEVDSIALYSGSEKFHFLDDRPLPFVPNPHYAQWAPFAPEPGQWLVFSPGRKPRLHLHRPVDFWHKVPPTPDDSWLEPFEVEVHRIVPESIEADAAVGDGIQFFSGAVNSERLLSFLHFHRATKTQFEIACMERASKRAVTGHRAAERAFRAGASELSTHLAYLEAMQTSEGELPYASIVAHDQHAAVLHYQQKERQNVRARSLLIDAGAAHLGYAADITRTYAAEPGLFADLLAATDEAQLRLVDGARAGVDFGSLHKKAHKEVAGVLQTLGIVTLSVDEQLERQVSSVFFPHGLGHLIGLQVHDVGGYLADDSGNRREPPEEFPHLRTTRELAEGMVVTIEPGIYFIDALLEPFQDDPGFNWRLIDELRPFGGVRIEDDVLVEEDGPPRNFTREAFAAAGA